MSRVMMSPESNETMRDFFVSESADMEEYQALGNPGGYQDHMAMMEAQYENDRSKLLESATLGAYNPVMGLVFPLHKNLLQRIR